MGAVVFENDQCSFRNEAGAQALIPTLVCLDRTSAIDVQQLGLSTRPVHRLDVIDAVIDRKSRLPKNKAMTNVLIVLVEWRARRRASAHSGLIG